MADWTEKHRPSSLSEVQGNDSAVEDVREWARSWDDHREAAVLHGSPGIGKTSTAHALAADMGWETVELNASDSRTGDEIDRFAGRAADNQTLSGASGGDASDGRQLVILDEADNVHGNADHGGARAITRLVKEARQPVLLIANDYYEMSRGLRSATREIEFRDVSARSIRPVLRDLCRKEGVEFESAALERIADRNDGDLRGAVNDLQAIAEGRDSVTEADVVTSGRDGTVDLFPFLDLVLKEAGPQDALQSSYDVDETPDDLTGWIEENVPKVYEGGELARAYDHLANADVWLGRVRATQDYSYWRYAGDASAAGVAAARDGSKGGWTRWSRPDFYHSTSDTAEYVVRQIARAEGVSMATARREVLPFLRQLTELCKPRELTVTMAAAYDLDESHVSFVTGSGESTNKVARIVEDAAQRRAALVEEHAGGAFAPQPVDEASDPPEGDADESGDEGDEPDDAGGLEAFAGGDPPENGTAVEASAGETEAASAADGDDESEESADDGSEESADDETPDDQSGLTDFM